MEEPTASAHFLFPTVVYRNLIPNRQKHIAKFLEKLDEYKFDTSNSTITGEYAGKVNIHHDKEFEQFFNDLKVELINYFGVLGVRTDLFDFYVAKAWLSIIDEDKTMNAHTHSESHISFVFYINVPKNSHAIWFMNQHMPNEFFAGLMNNERPNHTELMISEINPANQESDYFVPEQGMLLLFPGKLPHFVAKSPVASGPQEGTRICLAGDINIHLKPGLNNFEAGRMAVDFMRKL